MSTSESKRAVKPELKGLLIYLGVSVFCLIFFLVYDKFSHGVQSPYMTWLFAFPLVLGGVPCSVFLLFGKLSKPKRLCVNFYNSGVAAVTVSSALGGVFEIAGNDSVYQQWLMVAGVVMLLSGVVLWIARA